MRKLLGGLATLTAPVIAMAHLTGCQQAQGSQPTAQAEQHRASVAQPLVSDLAAQCGFSCKALADGEANISGIRGIDAFFAATLKLESATAKLRADLEATLGEMAAAAGAEVGGDISATADNIAAAVQADFGGRIDGGITLTYQEPVCQVSAQAAIEASAKCDATVEPGSAEVQCSGECVAEANVQAECDVGAELECKGTAPSFNCEGSCEGTCELNAGAQCEGTCKGSCELDGSAACDGECLGDTDDGGNCTGECKVRAGGTCTGECKGSCELSGGAECDGKCKGECTYTPPEGECTGSARASCKTEGNAMVSCKGECRGEVEPPEVSAECEATAKAEAEFSAECTPPKVGVSYEINAEWEGSGDASAEAELGAQIEAFASAYGKLLARGARIDGILTATLELPQAGANAVGGAIGELSSSASAQVAFKAACAAGEVDEAVSIIDSARGNLEDSVDAIATVSGSVGS